MTCSSQSEPRRMDQALLIGIAVILAAALAGAIAVAAGRGRSQVGERARATDPASAHPAAMSGTREEREPPARMVRRDGGSDGQGTSVGVALAKRVVEVSSEESGVTRRRFFNRAVGGLVTAYFALLGTSMLAFVWPRLSGGFGTKIDAGPIEDLKAQMVQPNGQPRHAVITGARAYIVPVTNAELGTSQFGQADLDVDGVMALWWRCVHLGCRTPWCASSIGFECPCHGSKYNLLGEYEAGPAPRNLDRFAIELTDDGHLIIDTGTIIQTPRAPSKTVEFPRGPFCV